jgi:hypothetical protein
VWICIGRAAIISLLAAELYRRLVFGKRLLELIRPLSDRNVSSKSAALDQ